MKTWNQKERKKEKSHVLNDRYGMMQKEISQYRKKISGMYYKLNKNISGPLAYQLNDYVTLPRVRLQSHWERICSFTGAVTMTEAKKPTVRKGFQLIPIPWWKFSAKPTGKLWTFSKDCKAWK